MTRRQQLKAGTLVGVTALAGCSNRPEGDAPDSINRFTLGPDDDSIPVLKLFEDYACPHCRDFNQQVLPQLVEDYVSENRLRIAHYDFPIPVSTQSQTAAQSGWVVQSIDKTKFWEYKSYLFENQNQLGYDLYQEAADEVGLNGEDVVTETRSGEYSKFVTEDRELGTSLGVRGTPALFIGETQIEAGEYNVITNQIEQILANQQ